MARTSMEPADHVVVGAGAAGCVLAAGPSQDPSARVVLGVDGLRVVDASVMPTINRGHTQAPTMLAAAMVAAGP